MKVSKNDKLIIMSWIENTSTSNVHEIFKKLGYRSAEEIYQSIRRGSKTKDE